MRTIRCIDRRGVGVSALGCLPEGGVCPGEACLPRWRVSAQVVCPGGVSLGGVCPEGGGFYQGDGVCPIACLDTHPNPPVDRMADACENITMLQLDLCCRW